MMLKALIEGLSRVSLAQITLLLDWRFKHLKLPEKITIIWVDQNQDIDDILPGLIKQTDCVWPIAPEMGGILQKISELVEENDKKLLNSSSEAVAICSDKYRTFQILKQKEISVVKTFQLDTFLSNNLPISFEGQWVIKPKMGVGCLDIFLVSNQNDLSKISQQLENNAEYIIQPYIKGESLSLSCLFKEEKAWLLCCNRQQISIQQGEFKLNACEVNITLENLQSYQHIINRIAKIILGLWGYVGIDFILNEFNQLMILEINPRLTTSYVGINQATGINLAKTVLEMIDSDPVITTLHNKQINVSI